MKKSGFLLLVFILTHTLGKSQSVAINTDGSMASTSSIFDVKSIDKGILIPRMSKTQKEAIATPANGLLIYQNAPDSIGFYYYNGSSWLYLLNNQSDSLAWKTTGNIINGSKFIGTLNDSALNFRINNIKSGFIDSISFSTAIGFQSIPNQNAGQLGNTAFGYKTLLANRAGFYNAAFGLNALRTNVTGYENVAIGTAAMRFVDSSSGNVAIGSYALYQNNRTDFSQNVAIGSSALENDVEGIWNTTIGGDAMQAAVRSGLNSAIGFRTLKLIKDGGENSTLGVGTMEYKDTAVSCVAIGRFALSGDGINNNTPDTGSIAIGTRAGRFNNVSFNTFIGYESGIGNNGVLGMTGKEIVSIGSFSLRNLTSGSSNSTFGYAAMQNTNTGRGNVGIGTRSLFNNRTGNYNVSIGDSALYGSSTNIGDRNIAIGAYSLRSAIGSTANNIAIGDSAMQRLGNGNSNIALGSNTLSQNVNGIRNVAIGTGALYTNMNSSNVAIGFNAGYNESGPSKLYIENSDADKDNALIYGDFTADSLSLNAKVNVRDFTRLGTQVSGAPAIKMKKLLIPSGPAVDAFDSYPMGSGITDAKVIGVQIFVTYSVPWKIPASYRDATGYEFNYQVQNNNIVIINKSGNSANIGAKPFTVLITYEE